MKLVDRAKKIAFKYTKLGVPRYRFNIDPIQLATLIFEIDRLKDVSGSIVEIGVAAGRTTRFLCEHIVRSGYTNQSLYAIDTFNSFLGSDVDYEVSQRGKERRDLDGLFGYNSFEVWKKNFSGFPFVTAFKSDCGAFDYSTIAPIKVAFLDVDLYLPTKRALPKIYEYLCSDGVILVDDVSKINEFRPGLFDGSRQGYMEFCSDCGITPNIIGNNCGIIRK
jgi:hypothetical protein